MAGRSDELALLAEFCAFLVYLIGFRHSPDQEGPGGAGYWYVLLIGHGDRQGTLDGLFNVNVRTSLRGKTCVET